MTKPLVTNLIASILLVTTSIAATESVSVDTKTKKVQNPVVKFGSGNTLDCTGATVTNCGGGGSSVQKVTFGVVNSGVLTTGVKNPGKIGTSGTLTKWTAMCKPSGSVTIDILRSANGAGLPVTSMVGGGTKPAISSDVEAHGTITDWNSMALSVNDNLTISLSAVTNVTYVEITLYYQ